MRWDVLISVLFCVTGGLETKIYIQVKSNKWDFVQRDVTSGAYTFEKCECPKNTKKIRTPSGTVWLHLNSHKASLLASCVFSFPAYPPSWKN